MFKTKHKIVSKKEIQTGLKLKGFFGGIISSFIMIIFSINKLNRMYNKCYADTPIEFGKNCLSHQNIKLLRNTGDHKHIPKSGPVIFLFNHPYGGLDALAISSVILEHRPDTKFIANFLLSRIEPIAPYLFEVNPFETRKEAFSSLSGLKEMYKYLEDGNAVCLLPAGEVSTKYKGSKVIEDRDWQSNMMKLIRAYDTPIISGYISGQNSRLFHFMGKIHPALRTAMLPRELLRKKNTSVYIRFSGHSTNKFLKSVDNNKDLAKILKAKTYCLADKRMLKKQAESKTTQLKEIINKTEQDALSNEIKAITANNLLFKTDNYLCFFASTKEIPNIFREISRLREVTFREIGEGTGKEHDTDTFDHYYKHLFIWDANENCLVGAYRIGMGKDILKEKGIEGFYINTLFKLKQNFIPYLERSMEMGRSFIVQEYQRKALPLFLLWKGIYFVTQKLPEYKYLIGPVSISSLYSENSKTLIVEYLKRNHKWSELNQMVECKIPYNYTLNHQHEILLNTFGKDISTLDRLIRDIDLNNFGIPVLIKKYLSLGGKILDFNIDPKFNYSVDGLVVLEIDVVSEEVIKSYNK
ncbi:MAG: lysophospholipid acyltransferase family protein [Bacteroidales bacterium]|nr:lysophospholipid acyltransferase family protein [Bacteroidales bacterium]